MKSNPRLRFFYMWVSPDPCGTLLSKEESKMLLIKTNMITETSGGDVFSYCSIIIKC